MALILASQSPIRRTMLEQAGVAHQVIPANIDEEASKRSLNDPAAVSGVLAEAKAVAVSGAAAGNWVIGSDSVVAVAGRLFDKPASREQAADHLRFFSGKAMALSSAVALARDGKADWTHGETAKLQVRPLSEAFIDAYLDAEWPAVGGCVGVFRLEGPGIQLFERIEGDHFTILGMPLLPLLGALRERGVLTS